MTVKSERKSRNYSSSQSRSEQIENGHGNSTLESSVGVGSVADRTAEQPPDGAQGIAPRNRRKKRYAVSTRWEREVADRGGSTDDFHKFCCCCARRLGSMFVLWEKRDGSPVVIAGPCWPFCTFVTVPLIVGISAACTILILFNDDSNVPQWIAYIYLPILGIVLMALFFVSCRDPGLLERVTDEEAGEGGWIWNEQVGSFRPPGALYCRECQVLIQDYDHLCPWTGTGIGQGNIIAFKFFVVGINILCYFTIALVAYVLLDGLATL
mmetsp:Transcript_6695/g.7386  ORF Transcript_6695/g.7386 Transcript_6695/m.7386 type:complete len:267 (+) Transcript_6695:24-824(+)|eukprot:CAMPEP_0195287368 /NCGR_PEP_ID=MMETSP0707-20130614/4458_1 /TAXON_ID=33640 /ORGANISM="Asterionellopsis glacialis, Strain CCMP134" /LENGTH=266 /DNA_ID=CAMNT_0040347117 /DNA_START=118 /DNA_END=918 /DNA_ORIENTATION=-